MASWRARPSRRNQARAIRRNGARDISRRICAPTFHWHEVASYPIQYISEHGWENDVEIITPLATPSVTSQQLDAVVESLTRLDGVSHARCSSRANE